MNTVTTTENCITGFACKINQINEEKKQPESAIQKEIQKDSKKDMHNLNIRKNAENKMIKNDKKNKD